MLTQLAQNSFDFSYDDQQYTTTYKSILYVALIYGVAISLMSAIFGLILSGPLALLIIIVSPLFVCYLTLELKEKLIPVFVQNLCTEKLEPQSEEQDQAE
ncbi:hypothetical protein [Pseudoalteromonas nigrifaciens]|uniref:hypothetical protein n=1 Tax=Pseudoalteromonas nigrifaciens TaxID=28109 RepID=UPI003FD3E28E